MYLDVTDWSSDLADALEKEHKLSLLDEITSAQPTIQHIFEQYQNVITDIPGTTNIVQARIDTADGTLVSLPPYRIHEANRDLLKAEIDKLVAQGIFKKHERRC